MNQEEVWEMDKTFSERLELLNIKAKAFPKKMEREIEEEEKKRSCYPNPSGYRDAYKDAKTFSL